MKIVRWGMIGAGNVTEIKSGPALQRVQHSSLVAVMRRTPGLAADYAQRHGIARHFERARDLIRDPEVDAVYIATPPGSHAELALMACEAGKPAYVEKPMGRHYPECRLMIDAFSARAIPLFVAYYRRSLPRFMAVKAILAAKRLGSVTRVQYRYAKRPWQGDQRQLPWRLRAEHSGGGLFLDLGCHALDLIDYLFGPILQVEGTAANLSGAYDVEDQVTMSFRLVGAATGAATWNFTADRTEDVLEITGTDGSMRMSVFGNEPIVVDVFGAPTELIDRPNPVHIQEPLIRSIVDELRGEGLCPSTGESAARTSRVTDTVLDEYYGGRADAFWKRPESWPGRPP